MIAMIVLLVASMIGASLLKTAILSIRQIRREQQRIQTSFLAEAGCQRGRLRLLTEKDYSGEIWSVPSDPASPQPAATVQIKIISGDQPETRRVVMASAEVTTGPNSQVQVTKSLTITAPASPPQIDR